MKLLFVWTGFTSYMGDCWRALAAMPGVELKVLIVDREGGYGTAFKGEKIMRGLDYEVVRDAGEVERSGTRAFGPDVAFIVGWREPVCRYLATCDWLKTVPKVCCFDMPWEWKLRKFAARFVLRRYLSNFAAAFVPGAVCARYARWLGFRRIERGLFGIDVEGIGSAKAPTPGEGFLFVGRLSQEKRIKDLAAAYVRYRGRCRNGRAPWRLDVYGMGPEERWLKGIEGVVLHGFVQPEEVRAAYHRAGAFVIASEWDPWPLVIAESCAAGLPVICTEHCWNVPELVKENGVVCGVGDTEAMAKAMDEISAGRNIAAETGRMLIAPYSCANWAKRVVELSEELV